MHHWRRCGQTLDNVVIQTDKLIESEDRVISRHFYDHMATNVIVAVRARPFNQREKGLNSKICLKMEDGLSTVITDLTNGEEKIFTFDHSYWYNTAQETVFNDLGKAIVENGIEGYNGTIFAYGQTGSGKTYSMMGVPGDVGLIPRLNITMFEKLKEISIENHDYFITVSYLEIYNEVIKDLLNPSDAHLKIREHPDMGIYVEGLAELKATRPEDIETFIEQGNKVRTVAETKMNARSSRSHSCFTIRISQKTTEELDGGVTRESKLDSKLNLVDLAGSERAGKTGAQGQQLKEAGAINLSLSALGNVINALAKSKKGHHIPYRDSKLTRLLQESLGGNARTAMIATLSPADDNYDESLSTLQYASRAKKIQNQAKRNEDVNEKVIRELKTEIEELRAQLAAYSTGKPLPASLGSSDDDIIEEYERKMAILEKAQKESWEEKEKLSKRFEEEREKILENENHIRDVMQTVKEENIELIKRLKALQRQKKQLVNEFKNKKLSYSEVKQKLENNMLVYNDLMKQDATGKHDVKGQLEELLIVIEKDRRQVLADKEELEEIKEMIQENEERQTEERAKMTTHKLMLQQDQQLRSAIVEEERKRFLKEKEDYLQSVLDKEREKLKAEAEAEVARVKAQYRRAGGADKGRERQLEINAIQNSTDKETLLLEIKALKQKHEHAIEVIENGYKLQMQKQTEETSRMVKLIVDGYELEMKQIKKKFITCSKLLDQAIHDIEILTARNEKLSREARNAK